MLDRNEANKIDVLKLYEDYENWPEHCEKALEIKFGGTDIQDFSQILFAGMGGSAASGDILNDWWTKNENTPFTVIKDYHLPKWVNRNFLIFAVSASGNTEEIIRIIKEALEIKCKIYAISSNGFIEKICRRNRVPFAKTEMLSTPRSSLPYLFYLSANILGEINKSKKLVKTLASSINILNRIKDEINIDVNIQKNPAKKLANNIYDSFPIIYASSQNIGVAKRFMTALNENAKMIAHVARIPELCHNEIEIFNNNNPRIFKVIFIRDKEESKEISIRFEVVKKLARDSNLDIYEYWGQGDNHLTRNISLTYFLDYVSIYSAIRRNLNPKETPNIDKMKNILRK